MFLRDSMASRRSCSAFEERVLLFAAGDETFCSGVEVSMVLGGSFGHWSSLDSGRRLILDFIFRDGGGITGLKCLCWSST